MDFSSQLANLQKTASAAASRSNTDNSNASRQDDRGPRKRHNSDVSSRYGYNGDQQSHGAHQGQHYPRDQRFQGSQKRHRSDYPPGPYRNPKWNKLKYAVDTALKYQPATQPQEPCKHLCLLAITIDELPFEAIWREWAERQSIVVSLICHAKEPLKIQSDWLKSRLLVKRPRPGRGNDFADPTYHSRRPEWGSIEITRAMIDLAQESLKIGDKKADIPDERFSAKRYFFVRPDAEGQDPFPPVDKVLFISETCLPIASLSPDMLKMPCSIVNARDTPNNGFSRQLQFEKMHSLLPRKFKADQWMMLSRRHLAVILRELPYNFWECFLDCKASDELYFPTAMSVLGILDEGAEEVSKQRITYSDWSMGAKNPVTFDKADELRRIVQEAQKEGCLVARKFVGITLDEWRDVVVSSSSSSGNLL